MSKPSRQSRQCLFCGIETRLSAEHFYPKWYRDRVIEKKLRNKHFVSHSPSLLEYKPGRMHRNGDPHSQSIRCVCKACNNGWMERLQTAAKPILQGLIDNTLTDFTPSDIRVLSRWVAMTITVTEQDDPKTAVVPEVQRKSLMNGEVPWGWLIFVGRCTDGTLSGSKAHRGLICEGQGIIAMQTSNFCIGDIVFHTLSFNSPEAARFALQRSNGKRQDMLQIWPARGGPFPSGEGTLKELDLALEIELTIPNLPLDARWA